MAEFTLDGVQYLMSFMGLGPGKSGKDISREAWLWTSDQPRWRAFPDVPVEQGRLASVAVGMHDRVLLFGGYTVAEDGSEVSTPEVFIIDPKTGSYKRRADMPLPVDDTVALPRGNRYIYLVSGWHDGRNVSDVQLYDTWEDEWSSATPFPGVPVFGHAGGIVGPRFVVAGGVGVLGEVDGKRQFGAIDQAWLGIIDPDDPSVIFWSELPSARGTDRYRMAATGSEKRGQVIFAGGTGRPYNFNGIGYDGRASGPSGEVFAFDLRTGLWIQYENVERKATMDHRGLLHLRNGEFITLGGMTARQKVTGEVTAFRLPPP